MASPADFIQALEQALLQNAAVVSVTVDGNSVRYDRSQAIEELRYWRRRLAREEGRLPVSGGINLGGAW